MRGKMMFRYSAALVLAITGLAATPALAADGAAAAAPAAPALSSETPLGDLLDNPAAKAVLQKHIPDMIANPQIEMARSMSLKQMQGYAGDALPDAKLAEIDADLAKVPAK
jgi:hypothetical protein